MRRRRNVVAAVGVATLAAVSGCTVPVAGAAGIAVDVDGRPMGVLMVCHDHIDGATLYTDTESEPADRDSDGDGDGDGDASTSVDVGRWSSGEPTKGFTTWSLDTSGDGWNVDEPLQALKGTRTYHLYGWTHDSSWSTAHVTFTAADLAALSPGQVRWSGRGDDHETGSVEDFRSFACRDR